MNTRVMKRWLFSVALLTLLAGCAGSRRQAAQQEPALVSSQDLSTAARADLATGVPVQGTLAPAVEVQITAPYPEILDAVLVKEGQTVRNGEVLARFRLESIGPAAASAEAQRRMAAADHTRMQNLLKEGAVAPRDLENAEAAFKAAEAQAAMARKRLEEATVRAPFDGVIARRFVQSGDRVGDGDPLFRLVNTDELEFSASVPTEALSQVRPGVPVTLTVSGLDGATISGRVARVNSTVDAATRQVKIYVSVPNRDHRLAGDMFATGRIALAEARAAVAIPTAAVRPGPGGTELVWVVGGGKVESRAVSTGLHDELRDLVEVKTGLAPGDTVIVSPIEGLASGQPVLITQAGPAGAATPARRVEPSAKAGARSAEK
jgi:RND family efflux transporter MFP subunit